MKKAKTMLTMLLLLGSMAQAKEKDLKDYPLRFKVAVTHYDGTCSMGLVGVDNGKWYSVSVPETESLIKQFRCVTFSPGTLLDGRLIRGSFVRGPVVELIWKDKNGHLKTCRYVISMTSEL